MPLNIAILASGNGSNAQAIFDKIESKVLDARVSLVISNRPQAKVLERAAKYGIKRLALDHKQYEKREDFDKVLIAALQECNPDIIVLAGYMLLLTPVFFKAFANKVINVHPALLPAFIGAHGASDATSWGVKISGCTVHLVDEEMDHGAIIAQAAVPVFVNEDASILQKRIQTLEHRLLPQVIQWFAEKRVLIEQRHISILPREDNKAELAPFCNDMASCDAYFVMPPLENGF